MIAFLDLIDDPKEKTKYERLYMKYRGLMASVAYGKLNDMYEVEEVLQEAFLYLAKNFYRIEDVDSYKTKNYVCVITEGFAIDRYRTFHEQTAVKLPPRHNESQAFDFDMYSQSDLKLAIDSLCDEYRNLIYLKYIYGYKSKEIAEIYNTNDAYIRKKLQFARAEIKKYLEESNE